MSTVFKPRRGKKSTMTNDKSSIILESGEFFIEVPEDGNGKGKCKVKIGDGVSTYPNLPYALGEIYSLKSTPSISNAKLTFSDDIGNSNEINIKGSGSVEVSTDVNGDITIKGTVDDYTHPNSGVTAGTYKSVTVNALGHITSGSNPTSLEGYGVQVVDCGEVTV